MNEYAKTPWTLCYDGQIDSADGHAVCRFSWDSYNEFMQGNKAATARLIRSAPELLAALREVLDIMLQNGVEDCDMYRDAEALIEKLDNPA